MRKRDKSLWILLFVGVGWFALSLTGPQVAAQTDEPSASPAQTDQLIEPPAEAPTEDEASGSQVQTAEPSEPVDTTTDRSGNQDADDVTEATAPAASPKDPITYGLWVLMPALVAIILAIFTRQVIPALVVGILVGAYMMLPCLPASSEYAQSNPIIGGFRLTVERYALGVIHSNPSPTDALERMMIIFFTLVIGFTVGVIGHNGGTRGMVRLVTGESASQRRGALTAWLSGMVVFFDDYANAMIVGPTMRPVFDRLKLSRAKLAYIVDSTAAPVASLALIGTWVGAEIGFIQDGLNSFANTGAPAFLVNESGQVVTGMEAFIGSLPYRFYPILALFMVFLVSFTGRDFGPMKRAQRRAAGLLDDDRAASRGSAASTPIPARSVQRDPNEPPARWWLGLFPILVLVAVTVIVLIVSGYNAEGTVAAMQPAVDTGVSEWAGKSAWQKLSIIVGNADAYQSILYGAVLSAFAAVLLTVVARAVSTVQSITAGVEGMCRMFPAVVILVLAWSLSQVLQDLQLGAVASARLHEAKFDMRWLPLVVFGTSAVISFATGTSWGTMGILCPAVVQIAAQLGVNVEANEAITLFYASVGSVLAGSVFGDHCSPISDTTVLSAIASECTLEEHVWTQLPYAFVVAIAAMAVGDVMSSVYNYPWYQGLGAGAVLLILWVYIVGRTSKPVPETPPPTPSYT